jgi:hypothetical protein
MGAEAINFATIPVPGEKSDLGAAGRAVEVRSLRFLNAQN